MWRRALDSSKLKARTIQASLSRHFSAPPNLSNFRLALPFQAVRTVFSGWKSDNWALLRDLWLLKTESFPHVFIQAFRGWLAEEANCVCGTLQGRLKLVWMKLGIRGEISWREVVAIESCAKQGRAASALLCHQEENGKKINTRR